MTGTYKSEKPTSGDVNEILKEHIHGTQTCYPSASGPVTLTSGVGAWTEGTKTQIIPASTITLPFDIHHIVISEPSANDDYEVAIYYGAGDTLAACIPFTRAGVWDQSQQISIMTPIIPKNSVVKASLKDGAGENTAKIKLVYHEY
jgi:hypothetical protein